MNAPRPPVDSRGGLSALDPAQWPISRTLSSHPPWKWCRPKPQASSTENQDVEVDLVGHSVKGRFNGSHEQDITIHPGGINERSRQYADQQRGNDFFGQQGQGDGDNWRQQREPTCVIRFHDLILHAADMNPATSFYAPLSSATSMSAIDTSRSVSCLV